MNFSTIGPRKKVVEPLQEAFFFPPPFCRMTSAAGMPVDNTTDVYAAAPGRRAIELEAEITVNPREGAGSSVADKVEFYKESDGRRHGVHRRRHPGRRAATRLATRSGVSTRIGHGASRRRQDLLRQLRRPLDAGRDQEGAVLLPAGPRQPELRRRRRRLLAGDRGVHHAGRGRRVDRHRVAALARVPPALGIERVARCRGRSAASRTAHPPSRW